MDQVVVKNFVNGKFQDPLSGEWLDNYQPSTGQVYGKVPNSNDKDIEDAYAHASKAFATWSKTTKEERSRFLYKIADLLEQKLVCY